jgi:hypothetical protein
MICDRDIWYAAVLVIKRYDDEALLAAAARASEQLEAGDLPAAAVWHQIMDCIERIQAPEPMDGEVLQ